ncbi:MAG: long-chain-acyl-CoA synthetase [Pseudomonadota bacterium]
MQLPTFLHREIAFAAGVSRTLLRINHLKPGARINVADELEKSVDRHGVRPALLFDDQVMTYADMEARANRYANWALSQGLRPGDAVALFMENRPDYICAWFGLAKAGVAAALINSQLVGRQLSHCLRISGARLLIGGSELAEALADLDEDVSAEFDIWTTGAPTAFQDLDAALAATTMARPNAALRAALTGKDVAFLIYTSGTTGLPKAARIPAMRALTMMLGFAAIANSRPDDVVYAPLPLYHAVGGVVAVGIALTTGGAFATRRQFSPSAFWSDCVKFRATIFQYVGEICRYLTNTPPGENDTAHRLRMAIGNGLRPDVWREFQDRFQIPEIREYYGSTEGNISIINYDGGRQAIGRVPGYAQGIFGVRIVKFDIEKEEPVRGPDGRLIECDPDEAGEAIGKINPKNSRLNFEGYTDKKATNAKVLRDVFKPGDAWFRTGDLMKRDRQGYFYFVDRIGDTFRWKGENVATTEVAEILSSAEGLEQVNVYGVEVPGHNGRAGMAAIVAEDGFDLARLHEIAAKELPKYARPLFIRLQPDMESTGTFKHRKVELVKEGFDPEAIADQLYFDDPSGGGYAPVTAEVYRQIVSGEVRV